QASDPSVASLERRDAAGPGRRFRLARRVVVELERVLLGRLLEGVLLGRLLYRRRGRRYVSLLYRRRRRRLVRLRWWLRRPRAPRRAATLSLQARGLAFGLAALSHRPAPSARP